MPNSRPHFLLVTLNLFGDCLAAYVVQFSFPLRGRAGEGVSGISDPSNPLTPALSSEGRGRFFTCLNGIIANLFQGDGLEHDA